MAVSRESNNMFCDLRGRGGFTLVELLVVIAIIAILSTIAVPLFLGQRTKAQRKEAMVNLEAIRLLQEQYYAEQGEYAASLGVCAKDNPGNIDAIRTGADGLPGFRPGAGTELLFSYCIINDKSIDPADLVTLVNNSPCFTAEAYGNTGTAVTDQELRVDCMNVKNY